MKGCVQESFWFFLDVSDKSLKTLVESAIENVSKLKSLRVRKY